MAVCIAYNLCCGAVHSGITLAVFVFAKATLAFVLGDNLTLCRKTRADGVYALVRGVGA